MSAIPDAILDEWRGNPDHMSAKQKRALIAAYRESQAALLDYESRISWDTTCQNCASILDKSYADYARAEKAGADLAALRAGIEALVAAREERPYGDQLISPLELRALLSTLLAGGASNGTSR